MNMISNKKAVLSWLIVLCMVMPFLCPVLTYAEDYGTVLCMEGQEYYLSETPLQNELGIMVSAKVLADAFSLDYSFDEENKAFEMYDEVHGTIVLMHNATEFYSGEKIYKCAPFFYVSNGEPLVEIGFFCNMFMSSYTYDEESNRLIINKNKLSTDLAKVEYNGLQTALFIEPRETDSGLETDLTSLAKALDVTCEIDNDTATLINHDGETITLKDGATTFTSTFGEFECGSFFNIVNDIPMINIGFFCDLYGICYTYNKENKTITLSDDMTMEEMVEEQNNAMATQAVSNSYVSGTITYDKVAPAGGYNVKLILQQVGYRYSMYSGSSYYAGNSYVLDTVNIPKGNTKSSSFRYNIGSYHSSSYPHYCLYFEESDLAQYGYYGIDGSTCRVTYAPSESYYYRGADRFSYYSNTTANIKISTQMLEGTISLEDDHIAPVGGLPINLILQTRTSLYTDMYGDKYYDVLNNNILPDLRIPSLSNSCEFSFDITPYNNGSSTYKYFSLFYDTYYNECTERYGYFNSSSNCTVAYGIPTYSSSYSSAKSFLLSSSYDGIDFSLPVKSSYSSDFATKELCYFSTGSTEAIIAGESKTMTNAPIKKSSNVYVPIRECAEAIEAEVSYNSSTKTVTFSKGSNSVSYKTGTTYCTEQNSVIYVRAKQVYNTLLDTDTYTIKATSSMVSVTQKYSCIDVSINGFIVPLFEAHPIDGTVVVAVFDSSDKLKEIKTCPASQIVDFNFSDTGYGDYCKIIWWENTIAPVTPLAEIDL